LREGFAPRSVCMRNISLTIEQTERPRSPLSIHP
jgi:hypothetical protein